MPSLDELLIFAARAGNDSLVRQRIQAGADVNHVSERHGTALTAAVVGGYQDVVQTLLAYGADPNRASDDRHGPLECALHCRQDEITVILLHAQARLGRHSRRVYKDLLAESLKRQGIPRENTTGSDDR